jgi:hypothetical protein
MQPIWRRTFQSFTALTFMGLAFFILAFLVSRGIEAQSQESAPDGTRQTQYPSAINLEFHSSPAEAAKALTSIDGLLNFSSEHSGLPIRTRVQGQLIDRGAVKQKIDASLSEEDVTMRLHRSSLVLKKLGLVPRDFDLRSFILDVEKDSTLAGFYDPATKNFYMLDWVPPKQQFPVMAHELTHALQDQYIGLESWMKTTDSADEKPVAAQGRDEIGVARRAVAEGQAMAVMMDYVLAPYGRTLTDMPAMDEPTLQQTMQRATHPAFLRAPRYIRESEAFPYNYGLQFVYQVLKKEGKGRAFAGTLRNPPLNTRQVMHPAVYLAGESTPPFHFPPLEPIWGSNYEMLDSGTLGEFDILMFAEQFGSEEKAPQIAEQWRGGYYSAAQRKTEGTGPESKIQGSEHLSAAVTPKTGQDTGEHSGVVALFYVSRWATPAAAAQFAHLYASSVVLRYSGATPRSKPAIAGQSAETSSAWSTPEGLVSVETRGPLVLVLESFDDSTASKLRSLVIARESSKSLPASGAR